MIVLDCQQGSEEWYRARLGIPTASNFSAIITPKGKPTASETRTRYLHKLLAEWALGVCLPSGCGQRSRSKPR